MNLNSYSLNIDLKYAFKYIKCLEKYFIDNHFNLEKCLEMLHRRKNF